MATNLSQVILIGDACHATAPNLAQGAGLSIEDALDLASHLKDLNNGGFRDIESCLTSFEKKRIPRARTVQFFADTIAFVGQLENPTLIKIRNALMQLVPQWIKSRVFELAVRLTLGWNYRPPKYASTRHNILLPVS
jgi:2-polyprenyl-6-methoxyphenol hydroxylase-like FAD-dependent oxidoreductase